MKIKILPIVSFVAALNCFSLNAQQQNSISNSFEAVATGTEAVVTASEAIVETMQGIGQKMEVLGKGMEELAKQVPEGNYIYQNETLIRIDSTEPDTNIVDVDSIIQAAMAEVAEALDSANIEVKVIETGNSVKVVISTAGDEQEVIEVVVNTDESESESDENGVPDIPGDDGTDTLVVIEDNVEIIAVEDEIIIKNGKKSTTTSFSIGSSEKRNKIFQGFEFGFTGVSYDRSFDPNAGQDDWFEVNTGGSINWSLNFYEADFNIIGEHLKLSTGLGYTVKNFSLMNNVLLSKDTNNVIVDGNANKDLPYTLEKNRLRTAFVTVPLMLHVNTNPNPSKSFRLGFGVQGGARIFETYRTKYHYDGDKQKSSVKGEWYTNPFILDYKAVIGYGWLNIYATYSHTSLFKENRGPELYPFTVGLIFLAFD